MRQFNVLSATPAGDPWQSGYGTQMQTYFLDLEGVDRSVTVMCNRKVGNPVPVGPIWAEAKQGTTKRGGRKLQLTIKPAPDGTAPSQSYSKPAESVSGMDQLSSINHKLDALLTHFKIAQNGSFEKPSGWAGEHKDAPWGQEPEPQSDTFSDGRPVTEPDVVLEDIPEHINLDDLPF